MNASVEGPLIRLPHSINYSQCSFVDRGVAERESAVVAQTQFSTPDGHLLPYGQVPVSFQGDRNENVELH